MRAARVDDIPRLIDLVGRLVARAGIPQQMDAGRVREVLEGMLASPATAAVWVTEAGFLAATLERTVISHEPIAVEHGWYAEDGRGMELLAALELWADCHGARVRLSTGAVGPDLSRLGYRLVEKAWVK
jgi:hypothetical protein